jgi:putative transposase
VARAPREEEPGATWHVTTHGVADSVIVRSDDDRRRLIRATEQIVRRQRWTCLAFCVMDTHYHLLVTTPETSLAAGVQLLNGGYAQAFNRRYVRRGHLFGARYWSRRVHDDSYLLTALRYVARNAVAAGIAAHPCDYRWSSYAGVAGTAPCWPFVDRAAILGQLGGGRLALQRLRDFVEVDTTPADALRWPQTGSDPVTSV